MATTKLYLIIQLSLISPPSYLIVIGEVVADKCRNKPWGFGYNAATDTYEDLLVTGVLDPAKVITHPLDTCIHDTLSSLRLFVTTFAMIQISSYLTLSIWLSSTLFQVTINAIENAASIAALVLTTEVLITELPKKEILMPADPNYVPMGGA